MANYNRIEAFFNEFEWLKKYIEPREVGEVSVGRINSEMIYSGPPIYREERIDWSHPGDPLGCSGPESGHYYNYYRERWLLIDQKGDLLGEVGKKIIHPRKPNYRWWRPSTWRRVEKYRSGGLGLALARLGENSGDVTFVLALQSPEERKQEVKVYKSPKNFSLKDWVGQLKTAEDNKLKQQTEAAAAEDNRQREAARNEVRKEVESV